MCRQNGRPEDKKECADRLALLAIEPLFRTVYCPTGVPMSAVER